MGLQHLGLQPYLIKAPNLNLGAPNPRTPILPILRHQPLGIQPYRFILSRNVYCNILLPRTSLQNLVLVVFATGRLSALWLHFESEPSKMNQFKRLSSRSVFFFLLCSPSTSVAPFSSARPLASSFFSSSRVVNLFNSFLCQCPIDT